MTANTLNLYCDNVLTTPEDFDFSEGYAETWDIVTPDFSGDAETLLDFADDCGVSLPNDPRDLDRAELVAGLESIGVACFDDESDELLAAAYADSMLAGDLDGADDWETEIFDAWHEYAAPMMNYRYPVTLRDNASTAAAKLIGLPLTLIECQYSGDYFLALTGGGMDLSAEICRAYIALGQRPPVHFCRVPRMAGRKYSQEFIRVLIESCEVSKNWANSTIRDLQAIAQDADYSETANTEG